MQVAEARQTSRERFCGSFWCLHKQAMSSKLYAIATIADDACARFSSEVRRKLGGRFDKAAAVFPLRPLFSAPFVELICTLPSRVLMGCFYCMFALWWLSCAILHIFIMHVVKHWQQKLVEARRKTREDGGE